MNCLEPPRNATALRVLLIPALEMDRERSLSNQTAVDNLKRLLKNLDCDFSI
ncbi:hypothetical protein PT974_07462 [Cladobotryum mycophilum]|uniref:Uncharacterized protein n=1 Tax=Cladobotryum mycophilum TaxID=491253 RepID=A0ABR0SQ44_9HYPO